MRLDSPHESRIRPKVASRTLSKSDFKLARTCDAKLFFRENGFPDNRDSNPYLALLAEGGYMVEALAKAKYVDGVQLEYGRGVADDFQRTIDQLGRDQVALFEATLLVGRQQARVDILEKKGNTVRLLEVKANPSTVLNTRCLCPTGKPGRSAARINPTGFSTTGRRSSKTSLSRFSCSRRRCPAWSSSPFSFSSIRARLLSWTTFQASSS
jgi:hypothetical protein